MKKNSLYFKFILFVIVLSSFAYIYSQQAKNKAFDHKKYSQEHALADLEKYPQDLLFYAKNLSDAPLISAEKSLKYQENFASHYYKAWQNISARSKIEDVQYIFERKAFAYAENLKLWDEKKWQKIHENANLYTFPNLVKKAITLCQTPLRAAPTLQPLFLEPLSLSNAYPFDMFQYSSLPPALPLLIVHVSADKAWYFVENAFMSGWVQSKDIAFVDEEFVKKWKTYTLVSIVKEKSVLEINQSFHAFASIGTLLPTNNEKIFVPVRAMNGQAELYAVETKKENYKNFPLEFTAQQVAELGQEIMGQNYGWGGFGENRDCSLMLQDIFINFAIYLPRNSALQAKIGQVNFFSDNKKKEEEIFEKAKPFASFVFKKGHIMLYVGKYEDQVMLFHNAWGLVAKNNERILIGKTVVTSLEAGIENARIEKNKILLNTIESFNNL